VLRQERVNWRARISIHWRIREFARMIELDFRGAIFFRLMRIVLPTGHHARDALPGRGSAIAVFQEHYERCLIVATLKQSSLAISLFENPRPNSSRTSDSRRVKARLKSKSSESSGTTLAVVRPRFPEDRRVVPRQSQRANCKAHQSTRRVQHIRRNQHDHIE
jgi:hypothetical protein